MDKKEIEERVRSLETLAEALWLSVKYGFDDVPKLSDKMLIQVRKLKEDLK